MGEHKEKKMNHENLEMSKKAMPADVSSVRTVFPALGSSSGYTYILQSQSGSVDCRSNTVMKSIRQSTLEKSMSCLPAGCRSHTPLPSFAQHQQPLFLSKTANLKQDHSFDGSKSSILMKNMTRDPRPEKCSLTCRDFPPGCGSCARVKDRIEEFIPDKSCDSSIKSLATAHVFKWRRNKDHADSRGVGTKEAGSQSQVKVQTSSMRTINKDYLRKENSLYDHCNDVNGSNRDMQITIKEAKKIVQCSPGASPDGPESLHAVPKSDSGIARPPCSELRNANVTRNDRHDSARKRVIATLRLYRDICRKLSWDKSKAGKKSMCIKRIDFHAAKEIKKRVGYVHGAMQFIGDVPGVEVGDKFHYRMELAVVGLHRPPQNGIDYIGPHPDTLATSVVASWDYADDLTHPEELVYLGQGGMPAHDKKAEDQKLTRGNLALMNSMKRNKPVRVIRKDKDDTLTYDGLYVVDKCSKIRRANRQMVFEFLMKRLPGQPSNLSFCAATIGELGSNNLGRSCSFIIKKKAI